MALSSLDPWIPRSGFLLLHGSLLTAAVIVPLAWYWYVMRPGHPYLRRAALAGATCAFLIPTLFYVSFGAWFGATHPSSQLELGALAVVWSDLFIVGKALLVGAPAGAVVGVLAALIQQHWLRDLHDAPGAQVKKLTRALTGAMVAILISPFVAFLVTALLHEALNRLFPRSAFGLSTYLAGTWLITIPIAAAAGRRFSARWDKMIFP